MAVVCKVPRLSTILKVAVLLTIFLLLPAGTLMPTRQTTEDKPTGGTMKHSFLEMHGGTRIHALHFVRSRNARSGGASAVVLVHGASEKLQNATYWRPLFPALSRSATTIGDIWAIDLPGHGHTPKVSGKTADGTVASKCDSDGAALAAFISKRVATDASTKRGKGIVVVARGLGAKVTLRALSELARNPANPDAKVRALVFIAPAISANDVRALPDSLRDIPVLFVWSKLDPFAPFDSAGSLAPLFKSAKISEINIQQSGHLIVAQRLHHFPEIVNPQAFVDALNELI